MRASQVIKAAITGLFLLSAPIPSATAQDSSDQAKWDAVGRLVINNRSMCTGALVAPDLVLTAAHCLYDTTTGQQILPGNIQFQAGLKSGKPKFSAQVISTMQHPQYNYENKDAPQTGFDLAMLRLQSSVPRGFAEPFGLKEGLAKSDRLSIVAYNFQNVSDPNFTYPCRALAKKGETIVISCTVDFGASGAPVFALRRGQEPTLVSVISAKAAMGGKGVAIGTAIRPKTLIDLLQQG